MCSVSATQYGTYNEQSRRLSKYFSKCGCEAGAVAVDTHSHPATNAPEHLNGAANRGKLAEPIVGGRAMNFAKRGIFVIACLVIASGFGAAANEANQLSASERTKLTSAAVELRRAILLGDAHGVGRLVSSSGLWCTDTRYRKAQVLRHLSNRSSFLYESLFDAARFSRRCGSGYGSDFPATSEKAFFETTADAKFEITYVEDDYAGIKFISPKAGYYPREYTFKKEKSAWKLSNGFIIGDCGCG